jgi:hypothetical protein
MISLINIDVGSVSVTAEACNLTTVYSLACSECDSGLLVCGRGRECVEFVLAVGVSEIHARQLECQ